MIERKIVKKEKNLKGRKGKDLKESPERVF